MRGRPSLYTPELAELICERIVNGEALAGICRDTAMPAPRTVNYWLTRRAEFLHMYSWACVLRRDLLMDEILEIADSVEASEPALRRARLRIAARKWHVGRVEPRKHKHRPERRFTFEVVKPDP